MHDKYSVIFDKYGQFEASGRLREKNLFKKNLFSEMITEIIHNFKNLGIAYKKYMANDQILVGQEKASLNVIMRDLVVSLVTMRFTVAQYYFGKQVPEVENLNPDFPYRIVLAENEYFATGKFSNELYNKIKTFNQWYNDVALIAMNLFIKEVASSISDKEINDQEIENIVKKMDYLLHLFWIMEYKLEITNIKK